MNARLTRQELLRRSAAGGALLAFPSLLAACGGGGGGGGGGEVNDVLNFSNWPYYIDTPESLKAAGVKGATTLAAVHDEDGHQGQLLRGHQLELRILRDRPGTSAQRRRHRAGHHRLHRQRPLPERVPEQRLGAEAGQEPHSEHLEPHLDAGEPALRPEPRVHAAVVLGHGRHRVERGRHRSGDERHAAPQRSEAEGQGRRLELDGRHARVRSCSRTGTTPRRSQTRRSTGRSPWSRRLRTLARSGASTATTTRSRSRRATSQRAWRGPATSSCSTTRRCSGASRSPEGSSSRTTCSSQLVEACRRRRPT